MIIGDNEDSEPHTSSGDSHNRHRNLDKLEHQAAARMQQANAYNKKQSLDKSQDGDRALLLEQQRQRQQLQQQRPADARHQSQLANIDVDGGSGKKTSQGGAGKQQQLSSAMASSSLEATGGGLAANSSNPMMSSNKTTRAYLASDNERHKRKLAKARERRATLILGLIMAAFICSWLPFFTFYVVRALCQWCRENVPPRLEAFIFWAGYCNSAINPIIYTIFNRDFRKAFRKLLLCK